MGQYEIIKTLKQQQGQKLTAKQIQQLTQQCPSTTRVNLRKLRKQKTIQYQETTTKTPKGTTIHLYQYWIPK